MGSWLWDNNLGFRLCVTGLDFQVQGFRIRSRIERFGFSISGSGRFEVEFFSNLGKNVITLMYPFSFLSTHDRRTSSHPDGQNESTKENDVHLNTPKH